MTISAKQAFVGFGGLVSFQQKTGYNWLSTYDSAISLFLAQLRLEYTDDDSNHLSNTE